MGLLVKSGIVGFGLLVAASAYEAYETRVTPPEVAAAQAAVSRDMAKKVVEAFPSPARWTSLSIDDVTPTTYRFVLLYAPGTAGASAIEADARAVAQEMLLHLAMAGHHPSDERTAIEVSARVITQDGAPGPVLGRARFDAARDRIVYDSGA